VFDSAEGATVVGHTQRQVVRSVALGHMDPTKISQNLHAVNKQSMSRGTHTEFIVAFY